MQVRKMGPRSGAEALVADDPTVSRRIRTLVWAAVACALALAHPIAAHAGWPLAAPARVQLTFGEVYSADDGTSSRHRGADIEASSGERVLAPFAGRVSFVGSVPGVGGGRVTAVTIDTARGKITLLPFGAVSVSRGADVAEGDGVGTLAGEGDGSSAGVHLHVSARVGDLYVDPLGLIAPPVPPSADSGAGETGAGSVTAGAHDIAQAPVGTTAPAGVSLAPVPRGSGVASTHNRATVGSGELAPGVSIAVRGSAPSGVAARTTPRSARSLGSVRGTTAGQTVQTTVLTEDGVVVASGTAAEPRRAAESAWLSESVLRLRALARRSVRFAGIVLLGVMTALGALWPLWRSRGKASGKVPVSAVGEDVAAAPSR